jgi:predicted hotdog family 3-hydroxylacyl-ACP dehydratase
MSQPPATLDRAGIAVRIPHAGSMCLLDHLLQWDAVHIHCVAHSHHDPHNPLCTTSGLLAPAGIEYAAQAMALHGALVAPPDGVPSPGYLASVRGVQAQLLRLDTVAGALQVHAQRLAGDERQILYSFELRDEAGHALLSGRATVVLNTPLSSP